MSNFQSGVGTPNAQNANPAGSNWAANTGSGSSKLFFNVVDPNIITRVPDDYVDMKMLMMKTPMTKKGLEFSHFEAPNIRKPLLTTALSSAIAAGSQQTIPVQDITAVGERAKITYWNGVPGIVYSKNENTGTITVMAYQGSTLPALSANTVYRFGNASATISDGTKSVTSYDRQDNLLECYNYIENFYRDTQFGMQELAQYEQVGVTNYVQFNRQQLWRLHYEDKSNEFWSGTRGEGFTGTGNVRMMEGYVPWMLRNSVYQASATPAQMWDALKAAMYATRHNTGNKERVVFATPQIIQYISDILKVGQIRFTAFGDNKISIQLATVDTGVGQLRLVPYQRFEQKSNCFPASYENMMILSDWDCVTPVTQMGFEEHYGKIGSLMDNNYTTQLAQLEYIFGTFSADFSKPDNHAIITCTA